MRSRGASYSLSVSPTTGSSQLGLSHSHQNFPSSAPSFQPDVIDAVVDSADKPRSV
jgi:hypothetical protein